MRRTLLGLLLAAAPALVIAGRMRSESGDLAPPRRSETPAPQSGLAGPSLPAALPKRKEPLSRITEAPDFVPDETGHTESATPSELRNFTLLQREDGSWGEGVEIFEGRLWSRHGATALALLSFLEAGYTHLTKETWFNRDDGKAYHFGECIKRGLQWLMAQPPAAGPDTALVAMALSEWYATTNSSLATAAMSESFPRLDAAQREDGSWGDPLFDLAAHMAFAGLRSDNRTIFPASEDSARLHVRDRLDLAPDASALASAHALGLEVSRATYDAIRADLLANLPNPSRPDYLRFWAGTLVLRQGEPMKSEAWSTWTRALYSTLHEGMRKNGSNGDGLGPTSSVVRDALASLAMSSCARYVSVGQCQHDHSR